MHVTRVILVPKFTAKQQIKRKTSLAHVHFSAQTQQKLQIVHWCSSIVPWSCSGALRGVKLG